MYGDIEFLLGGVNLWKQVEREYCNLKNKKGNYAWAYGYILQLPKFIVEVGACDLLDSFELADYFDSKVLAFEPDPYCVKVCLSNLEINRHPQVTLSSKCLGDTNGIKEFYVYSASNSSIFKHEALEITQVVKVDMHRYDSLGLPAPDLLVIDAQGSELSILEGFGQELKKVKYLIFETGFHSSYQTKHNYNSCNEYLKNLNFKFLASNVSGKGRLRFGLMWCRGIFYYFRKYGIKGVKKYPGFFDVLYINKAF